MLTSLQFSWVKWSTLLEENIWQCLSRSSFFLTLVNLAHQILDRGGIRDWDMFLTLVRPVEILQARFRVVFTSGLLSSTSPDHWKDGVCCKFMNESIQFKIKSLKGVPSKSIYRWDFPLLLSLPGEKKLFLRAWNLLFGPLSSWTVRRT